MQKIKRQWPKRNHSKIRWLFVVAISLVVVTGIFALLEATDRINLLGSNEPETTIGQQTKGEPSSSEETNTRDSSGQSSSNPKSKNEIDPNQTLREPTGNFVSNHEPNLGGDPAPNLIESVCVTTPGATCTITFEKDGIVKSLPAQTADAEGAAYWNWKLQDYGLTEGKWRIQAKAILGDQTKTAEDPLQLNVKP